MSRIAAVVLLLALMALVMCSEGRAQGRAWLNGTWEGTGYQIDTNETWTMRLVVAGKSYKIEYPSLNCDGRWNVISIGSWVARFRERITRGTDQCTNNGNVVIERLSRRQIAYRYSNPGQSAVTASAILNRKK